MPLVSVIVPMYNVEEFVGECIASLRAQTLDDFEAVCVNDGSTDDTLAVARRAAGHDSRFVFVERENGGLSAARNSGLDAATGDYVCFLDSDDWYEPYALKVLYDKAVAEKLDVLDFGVRTVYESERVRNIHEEDYSARTSIGGVLTGQELFARYWDLHEYISPAWAHFVKREVLARDDLRFGEGLLHEDELFTPILYAHASRAAFLNEALYCRRMREDSIMTRPRTMRNVHSIFRIAQILHAWLYAHGGECDAAYVDALAHHNCYLRDAAFRALQEVDEAAVSDYIDSLDVQDRIDFDLMVRYAITPAHERFCALENSRTYRAGNAVVALPRALRNAVKRN